MCILLLWFYYIIPQTFQTHLVNNRSTSIPTECLAQCCVHFTICGSRHFVTRRRTGFAIVFRKRQCFPLSNRLLSLSTIERDRQTYTNPHPDASALMLSCQRSHEQVNKNEVSFPLKVLECNLRQIQIDYIAVPLEELCPRFYFYFFCFNIN